MDRLSRLRSARNYALYYGTGKEAELARFDMAIVEPSGQTLAALHHLQAAETLVLAYLSAVEIPPFSPLLHKLTAADLLGEPGAPLVNPLYGNFLADVTSQRWVDLLISQADQLLTNLNYDGLFLDTLEDVESWLISPELRYRLLLAAAHLVEKLREKFPEHLLVMNGGLTRLYQLSAGIINGICWENPPLTDRGRRQWSKVVVKRLYGLQARFGLKVFLLLETGTEPEFSRNWQQAKKLAERYGWCCYLAPGGYVAAVNQPEAPA